MTRTNEVERWFIVLFADQWRYKYSRAVFREVSVQPETIIVRLLPPPRRLYNALRLSVCLFVCLYVSLYVCLSVCLSVYLLATLRKNYRTDLHENFTTDISVDKEELIRFWKSSASGSLSRNFRNFLKDSSTLRYRIFFRNLADIFGGVIGCSWKFYHVCILGQGGLR